MEKDKPGADPALTFEQGLKKLEGIVAELEKGELSLEGSLSKFEEGMQISSFLTRQLESAEKRIEILLKDEKGEKRVVPFEN